MTARSARSPHAPTLAAALSTITGVVEHGLFVGLASHLIIAGAFGVRVIERKWTSRFDYDLFVIGGGSGGVRAARLAAERGVRTAIAEESTFGGTCVNLGCIPKKFLVYACAFPEEFEDAVGYGWTVESAKFDWRTLIANKDAQIARLNAHYRRAVEGAGGIIIEDRAVLKDRHTVHLTRIRRDVTAETILIATGGYPSRMTDFEGAELCITSDEAFHLKALPKSIAIVGGGYIALEFAHIFQGLGAEVTLIYRGAKVLARFRRGSARRT